MAEITLQQNQRPDVGVEFEVEFWFARTSLHELIKRENLSLCRIQT